MIVTKIQEKRLKLRNQSKNKRQSYKLKTPFRLKKKRKICLGERNAMLKRMIFGFVGSLNVLILIQRKTNTFNFEMNYSQEVSITLESKKFCDFTSEWILIMIKPLKLYWLITSTFKGQISIDLILLISLIFNSS